MSHLHGDKWGEGVKVTGEQRKREAEGGERGKQRGKAAEFGVEESSRGKREEEAQRGWPRGVQMGAKW